MGTKKYSTALVTENKVYAIDDQNKLFYWNTSDDGKPSNINNPIKVSDTDFSYIASDREATGSNIIAAIGPDDYIFIDNSKGNGYFNKIVTQTTNGTPIELGDKKKI